MMPTEQQIMAENWQNPRPARAAYVWLAQVCMRLGVFLGLALCLGACSKCDVPDYFHLGSPTAPRACHGDAPAQ
jgi:hypothetical protein